MKDKVHIASATKRALADRAIRVADLLEWWIERLDTQMREQNVPLHRVTNGLLDVAGDDDLPVSFKRREIRLLLEHLDARVTDIRRLAPKKIDRSRAE